MKDSSNVAHPGALFFGIPTRWKEILIKQESRIYKTFYGGKL